MTQATKEEIVEVSRKVDRITQEMRETNDSERIATLAKDLRKTAEELKRLASREEAAPDARSSPR